MVPALAPAVPLDPADERLRLYGAVVGWLGRVASRAPVLLLVDEAREASLDLVQLLAHASRRLANLSVLVVLGGGSRLGLGRLALEKVTLRGLDEGAVARLLEQVADQPVTPDLARMVHDTSRGNPVYALELYRHLAEDHAGTLPPRETLPEKLVDLVAWRAANLNGDGRAALDAAACFGVPVAAPLVAAALGISRSRALMGLESGAALGFLSADADRERGSYYFDQPSIRDAVLGLMTPGARARLHRQIAVAIAEEQRERLRERAAELAYHYGESAAFAGGERGLNSVLLAAEQARAAYAHRRVVALLELALGMAPERDRSLRTDILGRLAVAQASAGLRPEALATASILVASVPVGAAVPTDVYAGVTETLRILRGDGLTEVEHKPLEGVRSAILAKAVHADSLARARLDLLGESWVAAKPAGIATLVWINAENDAAKTLLNNGTEPDGAEVMLHQRARTQAETAQVAELARRWRRPQSSLRALRSLVTDLVVRQGLFREGAAQAAEYETTAHRYGAPRDRAAALLLLARARTAVGEFAAAEEAVAAAEVELIPLDDPAEQNDELLLARLAMSHYRDDLWDDFAVRPAGKPSSASLLFAAYRAIAEVRLGREAEARNLIPPLLDAAAQLPPLTLYRDAALVTALAAAWEIGGAEHAGAGRSLVDLAQEAGAGGQIEGRLSHTRARMLALAGDVAAARDILADERPALDRAGLRPLRAIADHDEAIAIAAAGRQGFLEATRLLESAVSQFAQLRMRGWLARAQSLLSTGLEAASAPGGRLSFTYPRGLSRREADVVRLVAAGASEDDVARSLVLDKAVVERLIASALEKLGSARRHDLPRLARRYGLGGA
jgi:DNA-binding CsgD family transcriptional regulator